MRQGSMPIPSAFDSRRNHESGLRFHSGRFREGVFGSYMESKTKTPRPCDRSAGRTACSLEQIPQELVVNLVMKLNLGSLDHRPQKTRAAVGGRFF